MRTILTIVVLVLIATASSILSLVSFWLALVSFLALTIAFVYNALKKIPASPPHKGILTLFGERQEVALKEGWNFLPLYPFVFGFVLVKVEKVNFNLMPQQVRTPDKAVISVSASVTWIPGIKNSPGSYITYLNSGAETGVKNIIHSMIEDRVKTWAGSNKEGPSTWMEAQTMKDDAHEVLVKSLLGRTLPPIGSPIPTPTWMRFFDSPQSEPTSYDTAFKSGGIPWASKDENTGEWNWNGLQTIFDNYPPDEQTELKRKIEERGTAVKEIREGKGVFGDESLGITITRFSVNEVKVEGKVATAAELEETERRERDADTMEIDNVSARVQKLRKENPEMSLEEAIRTVQIERGKISKSVIEVLGASTGLGQDVLAALGVQRMSGGKSASGSSEKKGDNRKGQNLKSTAGEDML